MIKKISIFKNLIHFCLFVILIFFTFQNYTFSFENKIIVKVNNEIITSIDINDEIKYLKALNQNLINFDKKKIYEIAKASLIREKVKEIEISKFKNLEINNSYLENIIKNIYLNLNFKSKEEFLDYIKNFNIDISTIKKKLSIEASWNQLIFNKFYSNIKIDENIVREEIKLSKKAINSYLLYEIVYSSEKKDLAEKLFEKIKLSIKDNGFENTATLYSISNSSKTGGRLGWVKETSLNKKILKELSILKIGEYSNPILIPGGFLILKIKDKKKIEQKIDIEAEIALKSESLMNQKLNQFSNIYFNKILKDITINEK